MGIDIAIGLLLFFAFIRGYRQGFILTIFYVLSIAAAFFVTMHFSFVVSDYLVDNFNVPGRWLPVVAFLITFSMVVLIVRTIGMIVEKGFTKLLPTMFNRLLGSALWMAAALFLFAMLFNLLLASGIFKPQLIEASQGAPYLEELNHAIRDRVGDVVPFIKGLYNEVDTYFREVAEVVSRDS